MSRKNFYMIRKRFFVPKKESVKDYSRKGDRKTYDFLYESDYLSEEDDD